MSDSRSAGQGAGGSKSVSFETWKEPQPIYTATPAGSCIKSTGSSCRARRNVASFVFTQHGLAVGSASSGKEILIAFPSPPFSLVAQHIVKLSTASLSNAEDGLLVEKSCPFFRFLLLSQMQIAHSMEQRTLAKSSLLWHAGACCPKMSLISGKERSRKT